MTHTNCKCCQAPVTVHTDTPKAPHECEACETLTCKCGSKVFLKQIGMTASKIVCAACDNLVEANFAAPEIGLSYEAQAALGLVK